MPNDMTVDTRQFDRDMQRLVKNAMPEAIRKGLGEAGAMLMNDALTEQPTAPMYDYSHRSAQDQWKDKKKSKGRIPVGGLLRGSGSAFVDNKLVATTPKVNNKGRPAKSHNEYLSSNVHIGVVGFNTMFAARVHELPKSSNWSTPGSGPKFLESKATRNKEKYIKRVANVLKKEVG